MLGFALLSIKEQNSHFLYYHIFKRIWLMFNKHRESSLRICQV